MSSKTTYVISFLIVSGFQACVSKLKAVLHDATLHATSNAILILRGVNGWKVLEMYA